MPRFSFDGTCMGVSEDKWSVTVRFEEILDDKPNLVAVKFKDREVQKQALALMPGQVATVTCKGTSREWNDKPYSDFIGEALVLVERQPGEDVPF